MASTFEQECRAYFIKIKNAQASDDYPNPKKDWKKKLLQIDTNRTLSFVGNCMKVYGKDVIATQALDQAVINKFSEIPKPKNKVNDFEHMFLVYNKSSFYKPSRHFTVPGNGGGIRFDCYLNSKIDWSKVAALAHTHPFYKNAYTDRVNKYFSHGDPFSLLALEIPLYLRTPKGREIKVLEIRDNWVTTRKVSLTKTYKSKHWSPKS